MSETQTDNAAVLDNSMLQAFESMGLDIPPKLKTVLLAQQKMAASKPRKPKGHINNLRKKMAYLKAENKALMSHLENLAGALGACDCWGLNAACTICEGAGRSGYFMPDQACFDHYVAPLLNQKLNMPKTRPAQSQFTGVYPNQTRGVDNDG
jgi:hypothetical protein